MEISFSVWLQEAEQKGNNDPTQPEIKVGEKGPPPGRGTEPHIEVGKSGVFRRSPPPPGRPGPGESGGPEDGIIERLRQAITPIDPWIRRRNQQHLVRQGAAGDPKYMAPEMAKRAWDQPFDTEEDQMDALLRSSAYLFVWMQRPLQQATGAWQNFRRTLYMTNESGQNPVMYQVNLLRLKDCEKVVGEIRDIFAENTPVMQHPTIVNIRRLFQEFDRIWQAVVPGIREHLERFEQNARKSFKYTT